MEDMCTVKRNLKLALELLTKAKNFQERDILGASKLVKKIQAEISFLQSVKNMPDKSKYLKGTNLTYLSTLVNTVVCSRDVIGIVRSFAYDSCLTSSSKKTVLVDVVCNNGMTWVKTIARNPLALHRIFQGEGRYGEKHIIHQAQEYVIARQQHTRNFNNPTVIFVFSNGLSEAIADELKALEVIVHGQVIPNHYFDHDTELDYKDIQKVDVYEIHAAPSTQCSKAFFDVTALFAYVAEVTNSNCNREFKDIILQAQAEDEQKNPVLPKINGFIEGKDLYTCQTAVDDFRSILMTVGSYEERERGKNLLDRLTIVKDNPNTRALQLKTSAKVKPRSITVFGTSDALRATIITANLGFLRSAANQGVEFSAFVHTSRFLTGIRQSLPDEEYAHLMNR